MAVQPFKTNFSSVTNRVILVWYLHSNPLAEVGRIVLVHPNIDGQVTTATGLITDTYTFKFYESVDAVALTTLISSWSVDINDSNPEIEFRYYIVDGVGSTDPVSGGTTLIDPYLDGKNIEVSQRGIGFINPANYTFVTDTITLLGGAIFETGDEFTVIIKGSQNAGAGVSTSDYQDIKIISASGAFDNTFKLKHNISDGAANTTLVTDFPSFGSIADTRMKFSTYATSVRYWRLQFAGGNTVKFLGADVNRITLRKNEMVELFFKAGVCYVVAYEGNAHLAGEVIFASNKNLPNTVIAIRQQVTTADYQDLVDRLPAEMICTWADRELTQSVTIGGITKIYKKNHGKFAVDSVGGVFVFPDLRGQAARFLNTTDGSTDSSMLTQGSGGMWAQELIAHAHNYNPNDVNGLSDNANDRNVMIPGTRTSTTFSTGGAEQRVDCLGYYGLIRI